MMRALTLMLTLLLCGFAPAQEYTSEDRFGKTVDEVLAMGHDKWYEWFTHTDRGGESTAGMSHGEQIYADCLKVKVAEKLQSTDKKERDYVETLSKRLHSVMAGCVTAGQALSGGGTMWHPMAAGAEVKLQQIVFDTVFGVKSDVNGSQGALWKAYQGAMEALAENKDEINEWGQASGTTYESAVAATWEARNSFSLLTDKLKTRPATERRRVLAFCTEMFDLVIVGC